MIFVFVFVFGIVGGNVFVDINWYKQEKSWVLEGHSEVGAYKFCPNCWKYGKKCIIQELARF